MTWIAPEITRTNEPFVADERTMLEGWLDYHRQTLLWKCGGLTADQLKLRSVEPSTMSLLGLVRHMAEVERWWFRNFWGEGAGLIYCSDDNSDGDFDDVADADAEADFAVFKAEVEAAKKAVAERSLEDTHAGKRHEISLRWIYNHMIEEYARHNGHADLIRERIDGATGH